MLAHLLASPVDTQGPELLSNCWSKVVLTSLRISAYCKLVDSLEWVGDSFLYVVAIQGQTQGFLHRFFQWLKKTHSKSASWCWSQAPAPNRGLDFRDGPAVFNHGLSWAQACYSHNMKYFRASWNIHYIYTLYHYIMNVIKQHMIRTRYRSPCDLLPGMRSVSRRQVGPMRQIRGCEFTVWSFRRILKNLRDWRSFGDETQDGFSSIFVFLSFLAGEWQHEVHFLHLNTIWQAAFLHPAYIVRGGVTPQVLEERKLKRDYWIELYAVDFLQAQPMLMSWQRPCYLQGAWPSSGMMLHCNF